MKRPIVLLIPALVALLAACSSAPTPDASSEVIIPATTKVADASTRAALTAYDSSTGVLRFSQGSPALSNLKPGDVLVSEPSNAAPSGYLRKVTAIRQDGTDTVLDTTQANLTDAITQGELNADFQLTGDDLVKTEGLPKGVTLTVNKVPAGALRSQAGVGENYNFTLNFDHTFVPVQGPNATGTIRVDGGVNFNVGYGVDLDIRLRFGIPPAYLKSFQASVGFSQSSHLNITGDFQGAVGDSVLIGTQYFRSKLFFILGVPVVIVPKVELYLTAGGEIKAHVNFAAGESVTAQVGARWTKGEGWKNISGFGIQGNIAPPDFSGSLKPRIGINSVASFTIYDVAGPTAGLEGGVLLDVAYPRNPNWIVSGFMKGTLGFKVKLPILGTLVDYNATIFDISKELGRSSTTPPTLKLTDQPHTVNAGAPQNFRALCTAGGPTFGNFEFYVVSDAQDGCPPVTVTSSRDGALPPDYTFTSIGDRTITATTRNSAGLTAQVSFVLSVIDPPPTLTLNPTGDAHQGTPYSISANITDPNESRAFNFCDNTTWTVDAPDTLSTTTGCNITVNFGETGTRQVRVTTHDSYGTVTSQTLTVNVLPPPVNPYPIIDSASVYNHFYSFALNSCWVTTEDNGDTLDLTATDSCGKYTVAAQIENPQNEALTYDWKLYITGNDGQNADTGEHVYEISNQPQFTLGSGYGAFPNTFPCRVTLTLGAPDPSRNKSLTVWTGNCTVLVGTILK